MDKKTKLLIGMAVAFFAAVLVWAFTDTPKTERKIVMPAEEKNLTYQNNTIVEERDGRKAWELTAESIEIDPKTSVGVLTKIEGKFYQENGNVIELTAPQGVYDANSKKINFQSGVNAQAADGSSFRATTAQWDNENQLFYAEGDVRVEKDDAVLTGDKLESDIDFEHVKVSGNAKIVKGARTS